MAKETNPKKILIIKIGDLGDIALALTLIKAFKDHQIFWVCGIKALDLLRSVPDIHAILPLDEKALLEGSFFKKAAALIKIWKRLFLRRFDIVVTAHKDPRYKWISLFCLKKRHYFFSKKDPFPLGEKFHGQAYLDLVQAICPLEFPLLTLPPLNISALDGIKKPWIVLNVFGNPSGNKHLRYWDIHAFVELATLLSQHNSVILIGDAQAVPYGSLFDLLPAINLIGKTNLLQLLTVLQNSYCIITHDSGPLHLARLLKIRSASLFGPTHPRNFSLPSNQEIHFYTQYPCSPCYNGKTFPNCQENKCLKSIPAKLVYQSLKKHFAEIL